MKTPRFLALRIKLHDEDAESLNDFPLMPSGASTPSVPPGLNNEEEVGGAYVTISQRAAAMAQPQQAERTNFSS